MALLPALLAILPVAAPDESVDWQQTGLTGRLFTPATAALFVHAAPPGGAVTGLATPLARSDDGAKSWRPAVTRRPDLWALAVDPDAPRAYPPPA